MRGAPKGWVWTPGMRGFDDHGTHVRHGHHVQVLGVDDDGRVTTWVHDLDIFHDCDKSPESDQTEPGGATWWKSVTPDLSDAATVGAAVEVIRTLYGGKRAWLSWAGEWTVTVDDVAPVVVGSGPTEKDAIYAALKKRRAKVKK